MLNGDIQFGLGAGDGIASVLQLFAANQVGGAQRDTTIEIGLCLRERRFLDVDIRLQLFAVDHLLTRLANAGGQLGFRFFKCLLGIGLVQGDQRVALLHEIGVVGPDFRHAAGHLRHDLHLVPCHVSVIGLFIMTQYQKPINSVCHGNNNKEQCQ